MTHHQVNLIGAYSNHRNLSELLKRTRRWLSEGRQASLNDPKVSVQAKAKAIVPRRVIDRLDEETLRELIEARRAGAKSRDLAERYEVGESGLKRLLRASTKDLHAAAGQAESQRGLRGLELARSRAFRKPGEHQAPGRLVSGWIDIADEFIDDFDDTPGDADDEVPTVTHGPTRAAICSSR
jgi:hypothetical protein